MYYVYASFTHTQSNSLDYDQTTDSYDNASQVEVIVPGFGETETVEYLVSATLQYFPPEYTAYLAILVDYFSEQGYERGRTIRAAPYDWRLAPGIDRY